MAQKFCSLIFPPHFCDFLEPLVFMSPNLYSILIPCLLFLPWADLDLELSPCPFISHRHHLCRWLGCATTYPEEAWQNGTANSLNSSDRQRILLSSQQPWSLCPTLRCLPDSHVWSTQIPCSLPLTFSPGSSLPCISPCLVSCLSSSTCSSWNSSIPQFTLLVAPQTHSYNAHGASKHVLRGPLKLVFRQAQFSPGVEFCSQHLK